MTWHDPYPVMDGVKEPLERLMLLVDKLKADVNAVDENPLYMKVHN